MVNSFSMTATLFLSCARWFSVGEEDRQLGWQWRHVETAAVSAFLQKALDGLDSLLVK
jgi:hypothetical protein